MITVTDIDDLVDALPGEVVGRALVLGVDGFDGSGKTTLALELARRVGGIRIGLDCYIDKEVDSDRYVGLLRLENLRRDVRALSSCQPIIVVDGVCLSEAFDKLGCVPDYVVYVKKISAQGLWHDGLHLEDYEAGQVAGSWLEKSVLSYHQQYRPHLVANACYSRISD